MFFNEFQSISNNLNFQSLLFSLTMNYILLTFRIQIGLNLIDHLCLLSVGLSQSSPVN